MVVLFCASALLHCLSVVSLPLLSEHSVAVKT